jgi:hypothetical protein
MLISDVLAIFFLSYLRFRAPRLRVGLERRTETQTQPESSNNIRCPTRPIGSNGQPDSDKTLPDGHTISWIIEKCRSRIMKKCLSRIMKKCLSRVIKRCFSRVIRKCLSRVIKECLFKIMKRYFLRIIKKCISRVIKRQIFLHVVCRRH